ncbi:hypothetical protein N7527_007556 [Penicillium freii]|uniref:Transcription factor domain-containing protein n=1 Tax=Penicillium freii TaxID=48697 RepID=A0A101MGF4_PENFR|nr:hypothetical protein N7527_007556 [Penicillium freii]KUM60136.1 hypothetical protein ACN42_g6972 [Penicillium freii]
MITHLFNRVFNWNDGPASPHAPAWTSILLCQNHDTELSTASVRALAMVYFAKVNKQHQVIHKGVSLYAHALRTLQTKLQRQDQAMGDDVLVAIICLAVYELITLTQPRAWLSHYQGLARLMSLRGPHRHQSGIAFAMMPTLRSCIAIGYIIERKRCFLEDPAWKTIPWAERGLGSKTPTDLLQDIMCDIPGILQGQSEAALWDPNDSRKEELTFVFIPRVLSTLEALYSWRWNWESQFPNSTFITTPIEYISSGPIYVPPSPFKSVIWFQDPHRAVELIVYNAILLILLRALQIAGADPDNVQLEGLSDPLLPMQGNRNDIAIEICRMVDYHLHCLRSTGAFMLLFPLNVAYLHLDQQSTEAQSWLEGVIADLADSHGFEVGRSENMLRKLTDVWWDLRTDPYDE